MVAPQVPLAPAESAVPVEVGSAAFARAQLTFLLQLAYSGELAATLAYIGHRHSVSSRTERVEIGRIARDEIRHRQCLLRMLGELGSAPSPRRERKMKAVGRSISLFCQVGGWFFPMYGAAKLEAQNIREYELAARFAHVAGFTHLVEPFLEMSEVEWDHELYFRSKAMTHPLWRVMPKWPVPKPRGEIRRSFKEFEKGSHWPVPTVHAPLFIR